MNTNQIQELVESNLFKSLGFEYLIETYISYILICKEHVYKIKKPIKTPYLDYSNLGLRKYYCEQEILLNSRFTKNVYVEVVSIHTIKSDYFLNLPENISGYAVMMKRLDDKKLFSSLLQKKTYIDEKDILKLSKRVFQFHQTCTKSLEDFNIEKYAKRFNQIAVIKDKIIECFGEMAWLIIQNSIKLSELFIKEKATIFSNRIKRGFIVDCHGDLHSENIFLDKDISIIDCIEFNDEYRTIDYLDELASLLVDFNYFYQNEYEKKFLSFYFGFFPKSESPENQSILEYYKLRRAIIRFRANILSNTTEKLKKAERYLALIDDYNKAMTRY